MHNTVALVRLLSMRIGYHKFIQESDLFTHVTEINQTVFDILLLIGNHTKIIEQNKQGRQRAQQQRWTNKNTTMKTEKQRWKHKCTTMHICKYIKLWCDSELLSKYGNKYVQFHVIILHFNFNSSEKCVRTRFPVI